MKFLAKVIGLCVYLLVGLLIISSKQRHMYEDNYYDLITAETSKGDYESLLKMSEYYNPDPSYQYNTSDINFYWHETIIKDEYNNDSVYYSVFLLDLNKDYYDPNALLDEKTSLKFYCGSDDSLGNEIPISLDNMNIYHFASSGIYRTDLNESCSTTNNVTNIVMLDANGSEIMNEPTSVSLSNDVEDIKSMNMIGYTEQELRDIIFPKWSILKLAFWFSFYTIMVYINYKFYTNIVLAKVIYKDNEEWQMKHKSKKGNNIIKKVKNDVASKINMPEDPYL